MQTQEDAIQENHYCRLSLPAAPTSYFAPAALGAACLFDVPRPAVRTAAAAAAAAATTTGFALAALRLAAIRWLDNLGLLLCSWNIFVAARTL